VQLKIKIKGNNKINHPEKNVNYFIETLYLWKIYFVILKILK
jgi:hypothetical protein